MKRDTRNYFTTSNDATVVHSTITGDMPLAEIEEKKQNPHLEERAIVGAKKYRVMSEKIAEDHPILNTLGYAAGLAPFILPAAAATAAVAPVLSDAVATTTSGRAIISGCNWMADATKAARLIPTKVFASCFMSTTCALNGRKVITKIL